MVMLSCSLLRAALLAQTASALNSNALELGVREEGIQWLAQKKTESGVSALPSGLMYKVLEKGAGDRHPLIETPCSCNYEGRLPSGEKFDSSYDRGEPTTFAPNQVIKGWTEAMQMMVEGDKWELYVPSELAYGEGGSPPKIPGSSPLVFQMKLEKIEGSSTPANKDSGETQGNPASFLEEDTASSSNLLRKEETFQQPQEDEGARMI